MKRDHSSLAAAAELNVDVDRWPSRKEGVGGVLGQLDGYRDPEVAILWETSKEVTECRRRHARLRKRLGHRPLADLMLNPFA